MFFLALACTVCIVWSHFMRYRGKLIGESIVAWLAFAHLLVEILYPYSEMINDRIGLFLACILAAAGAILKTQPIFHHGKLLDVARIPND
jgi:hypothetical protein